MMAQTMVVEASQTLTCTRCRGLKMKKRKTMINIIKLLLRKRDR